jgi:hypothetical protein
VNGEAARRVDVFFYGLFMDVDVLRKLGASPENPRRAYAPDFALRIGERATLVPAPAARAYGMVIGLTHAELDRLYGGPGLEQYRAEALMAQVIGGVAVPALCYNLPRPPEPDERNPDYAHRLKSLLAKLGFPEDDLASIG